eukprot:2609599-Rhodomonas_salina.2
MSALDIEQRMRVRRQLFGGGGYRGKRQEILAVHASSLADAISGVATDERALVEGCRRSTCIILNLRRATGGGKEKGMDGGREVGERTKVVTPCREDGTNGIITQCSHGRAEAAPLPESRLPREEWFAKSP